MVPATPPLKGGESFSNFCVYKTNLRLTAMPSKGEFDVQALAISVKFEIDDIFEECG
jgi:hypothetical protein